MHVCAMCSQVSKRVGNIKKRRKYFTKPCSMSSIILSLFLIPDMRYRYSQVHQSCTYGAFLEQHITTISAIANAKLV